VVPVAGGEPKRLISEAYFAYFTMGLAWTPDGREIIFAADRGGSFGLWRVPATGGTPERLAGVGPNAAQPSISRQGNRLAYTQTTMDSNLWRLELSSSKGGSRAPAKPLAPSTQLESNCDSSPDGQRIVFISNRSGSFEIWVCEADGSNPVQLSHFGDSSGDEPGSPRWSPDGRYVAFDLFTEGQRDIAVVSAEGGRPRRLTREASQDAIPSWSADGRWVYFNSDRSGTYQIWKMPAQGGEALPVTKGGGFDSLESPDGKFLYYTKGREVPGIWRLPVGGGQETPVLDHHRAGYWRAWDVVADGIYFATAEVPSRPVIEFFSFATGQVTQIAQLEKPIFTTDQGLTVSPDQRWLVYVQIDQSGRDIMLVENFR
jgi:Tol biopolymer transport system component